jgi:uncharacterized protein YhfF
MDSINSPTSAIATNINTEEIEKHWQAYLAVFPNASNEKYETFQFGDRSLESWREGHWIYFSRVLPAIRKKPTPEMLLVCDRFRMVYK